MRFWLLLCILTLTPAAAAQACSQSEPCGIPLNTDPDEGVYFETPQDRQYNVTQGDWFEFSVFNTYGESHELFVEHYGIKMEAPGFGDTSSGPPGTSSHGPYRFTDVGSFTITDQDSSESATLLVAANDAADIEQGEEPVTTTSASPQDSATGEGVREVPAPGVVALLGVLCLAALRRR